MRNKSAKAQETLKKIKTSVGKGFRKNGYGGIGVDALAKEAGVTSGAFYAHMGSKEKAFKQALEDGLDEVLQTIPMLKEQHGQDWLKQFIDFYLSEKHAVNLECGCAMVSLTGEVVRHPILHDLYQRKITEIATLIAEYFSDEGSLEAINKAYGLLSLLTGGLNLARATGRNKKILSGIRSQALQYIS